MYSKPFLFVSFTPVFILNVIEFCVTFAKKFGSLSRAIHYKKYIIVLSMGSES